jgi:hypothetical protein
MQLNEGYPGLTRHTLTPANDRRQHRSIGDTHNYYQIIIFIALVFTVANFMLLTLIYEIGNLKNHEAWPVEIHVQGSYLFLD